MGRRSEFSLRRYNIMLGGYAMRAEWNHLGELAVSPDNADEIELLDKIAEFMNSSVNRANSHTPRSISSEDGETIPANQPRDV